MKYRRLLPQFQLGCFLALIIPMISTSVSAETANFSTLKLSPGFEPSQGITSGYTTGTYSLSAISNRDQNKKACIGFGDPSPDHIIVLEKDFDNLKILVNSGGDDTTLLIKGPDDETVRCGDDTGKSKDASVSDRKWEKGKYKVWVGIFNQGIKRNYTLTVQQ